MRFAMTGTSMQFRKEGSMPVPVFVLHVAGRMLPQASYCVKKQINQAPSLSRIRVGQKRWGSRDPERKVCDVTLPLPTRLLLFS
jgi:hypothetical protein